MGFRDVKGLAGACNDILLQPLLEGKFLQGNQRLLDVGERGKHRLAVGLEVLQLHAFRLFQLTFQQEAVEDRLGQRRRERVEPCARREQRCQRGALETGRACQLNLRKERRAGGFDAEVGGGEERFGLADVRPLIEQFRRQPRRNARDGDLAGRSTVDGEIRRRARDQHCHGGNVLSQRDFERRDGSSLGCHHRFLLRQVELRCGPAIELILDDSKNPLGRRQILAGHAYLLLGS